MNDHCNVLLLALSTFPRNMSSENVMSENVFEWENGKEYTGIYQLDPVPKMLIDQLAQKQEHLDRIILLATEATLREKDVKEISYLDGGKDSYRGSELEYFKSQIKKSLSPDSVPEFVVVQIDEKNIEQSICDTIDVVRKIKNIRLYLDTHGGFRDISLVMEAVISLLRVEGIEVEGIYGIEFGQEDQKKRIVDGRGGFHIFDFVSGMNEFINYGRVNSLDKFLMQEQNAGINSEGRKQQEELISSIKKISEGIQLCNIPAFEEGLDELMKYKDRYQKVSVYNNYLSIFVDNIMSDYGILLFEKRTVVDEIAWCRKKGFYQQILTLVESRMPRYLEDIKICRYGSGSEDDIDETNVFNRCVPWSYYQENPRKRIERIKAQEPWRPNPNKQSFREKDTEDKVSVTFSVSEAKAELLDKFLRIHVELKNLRNISNHALAQRENKSLAFVDRQIAEYLATLKLLTMTKYHVKIKNVSQKGNVMLSVLDGIQSINEGQYVLERPDNELDWGDNWKRKHDEDPDQVYEVEFIKIKGSQYCFRLAEMHGGREE